MDPYQRYVNINLPHARTIVFRIGRSLTALGAFREDDGGALALQTAFEALEQAAEPFDEDPAQAESLAAADRLADLGRMLVAAIQVTPCRSDRLGQSVRNLFECLGLPEEGAQLSLDCGERPDSPLR